MRPHEKAMQRELERFLLRFAAEHQTSHREAITLAAEALRGIWRELGKKGKPAVFSEAKTQK
jgi:hypothetical protein